MTLRSPSYYYFFFRRTSVYLLYSVTIPSLTGTAANPISKRYTEEASSSSVDGPLDAVFEATRIFQEHRTRSSVRRDALCNSAANSCSKQANRWLCSSSIDISPCTTKPSTQDVCKYLTLNLGEGSLRHTCFASLWMPFNTSGLQSPSAANTADGVRPPTVFTLKLGNAVSRTFILPKLQAGQTARGGSYWVQLDVTDLVEKSISNSSRRITVLACSSRPPQPEGKGRPGSAGEESRVGVHDKQSLRAGLVRLNSTSDHSQSPLFILGTQGPDPLEEIEEEAAPKRVRRAAKTDLVDLVPQAESFPGTNQTSVKGIDNNPRVKQAVKERRTGTTCSVQPLRLNIRKDLGLKGVVFPKKFWANDCRGRCSKRNAAKYASHHGRLKALLRNRGRPAAKSASGSCCIPTKFGSLSVLMRMKTGYRTVWLDDVIVKQCACS